MNRTPGNPRFERNHDQAQRLAAEYVKFIIDHIDALAKAGKSYVAVVMKGLDLPSVPLHVDGKRRGLRF